MAATATEPLDVNAYLDLKARLVAEGYAEEIDWAATVAAPQDADVFAREAIFVICNSGMKAQVATGIYRRIMDAIAAGQPAGTQFGHEGKSKAIDKIWRDRASLFECFNRCQNDHAKLAFLQTIPFIGGITKYHLARNFGMDLAKPDRHLVRVAKSQDTTPQALCETLARGTGDRVGEVDVVIWRACNLGML